MLGKDEAIDLIFYKFGSLFWLTLDLTDGEIYCCSDADYGDRLYYDIIEVQL